VPAVLGYNVLLRRNKTVQERVSHFTHDLHAYLISGVKMGLGMDSPRRIKPSAAAIAARDRRMGCMWGTGGRSTAMSDINVSLLWT